MIVDRLPRPTETQPVQEPYLFNSWLDEAQLYQQYLPFMEAEADEIATIPVASGQMISPSFTQTLQTNDTASEWWTLPEGPNHETTDFCPAPDRNDWKGIEDSSMHLAGMIGWYDNDNNASEL